MRLEIQERGVLIASLRKDAGLKQEQLAKEANIDLTTLNRIEKGRSKPRVSTLVRIADALKLSGVNRERVLTGEGGLTSEEAMEQLLSNIKENVVPSAESLGQIVQELESAVEDKNLSVIIDSWRRLRSILEDHYKSVSFAQSLVESYGFGT